MRLPRTALAAAATAALALALSAAAQPAWPATGPAHRAASPAAQSAKGTMPAAGHCTTGFVTEGGKKAAGCFQAVQQPLNELSPAQLAAVREGVARFQGDVTPAATTPPDPPNQCKLTPPSGSTQFQYTPAPDRGTSCIGFEHTLNQIASDGTTVLGTFQFVDLGWASFSTSSVSWTHGLLVLPVSQSGSLTNASIPADLYNGCGPVSGTQTLCTATGIDGTPSANPLVLELTFAAGFKFAWTESDTHSAGDVDILDNTIGENWVFTGFEKEFLSGPENLFGSCDYEGSTLGATAAAQGCVDERFVPTLTLPISQYGSAAAMIQWAENNLASHWGLQTGPGPYDGNPLRRMYNPTQTTDNRAVICPSSFPTLPGIGAPFDTDSCDEYPFAATYESGATITNLGPAVTSGNQCAQTTARSSGSGSTEPQVWNAVTLGANTGNTFAACTRGHIPLIENKGVGTAYSSLIATNRLLDMDPFWVSVTS